MAITLGVDIGGTSIKLALMEGDRTLATARGRIYQRPDRATFESVLADALRSFPRAAEAEAIGLCAPGLIDPSTLAITLSANHPGLVGVPLNELLAAALGRDVAREHLVIISDAHAAAHDFWHTADPPIAPGERLLAISLGTGVGACVLDDGRPLQVSGTSSGHLGQIDLGLDLHTERPIGPDGGAGSAEAYLGIAALKARFGTQLVAALTELDPRQAPGLALVQLLRIAHAIYRPAHMALLGGIGMRLAGSLPAIRVAVARDLTSVARPGWTLRSGSSDFHAACGVARIAGTGRPT